MRKIIGIFTFLLTLIACVGCQSTQNEAKSAMEVEDVEEDGGFNFGPSGGD